MKGLIENIMKIELLNTMYEVFKDENDVFNLSDINNLITDYFLPYDYILGDYAYGRLRLKGFYDVNNKKVSNINNIKFVDKYINDYCAYMCKYFILKKSKN